MANQFDIIYKISADITGLKDGVNKAATAAQGLEKLAFSAAGALAGMFTVTAAVGFAKALIADADALKRLSDQTGISTQGLQRFQIAGDDAGNSVDQLTNAITKMEDKLASGDKSALAALKKLQIPLEDIKNLSPENQFIAISEAIRKIQDPAQQVALAIDLFGKQGATVLPTLKRGFDDVKGAAVGMSDETIAALDEAGDMMEAFWRRTKAASATGLVAMVHWIQDGLTPTGHAMGEIAREADAAAAAMKRMTAAIPPAPKATGAPLTVSSWEKNQAEIEGWIKSNDEAIKDHQKTVTKAAVEIDRWQDALARAEHAVQLNTTALGEMDDSELIAIQNYLKFREGIERVEQSSIEAGAGIRFLQGGVIGLGQAFEVTTPQVDEFVGPINEIYKSHALQDLAQGFAQLAQISGGSFGGIVQDVGKVVGSISVLQTAMKNVRAAVAEGGKVWAEYAAAAVSAFSVVSIGYGLLFDYIGKKNAEAMMIFKEWRQIELGLGERRNAIRFEIPTEDLAKIDAMLDKLFKMPKKTPFDLEAIRKAGQEIDAILSRFEKLSGEASSRFGPSKNELDAAVKDAADVLDFMQHATETSVNKITGEVTTIAQYTADQIAAAYYAWQKAMADAGNAAAQAWVKMHDGVADAVSASSKALDDLKAKRDSLAQSVANEAPEEVMGVIESQTRGQIAVLDEQIKDQQQKIKEETDALANEVEKKLSDIHPETIHIPYDYVQTGPSPDFTGGIKKYPEETPGATGGIVYAARGRILPFARGTDSVPAMLTPGEWVVNEDQQKQLASLVFSKSSIRAGSRSSAPAASDVSGDIVLMVESEVIGRIARRDVLRGGKALQEMRTIIRTAS